MTNWDSRYQKSAGRRTSRILLLPSVFVGKQIGSAGALVKKVS